MAVCVCISQHFHKTILILDIIDVVCYFIIFNSILYNIFYKMLHATNSYKNTIWGTPTVIQGRASESWTQEVLVSWRGEDRFESYLENKIKI